MKKTFSNSADIKLENSAYLREETLSRRRRDEYELSKKLIKGEWSRVGCRTELDENWTDKVPLMINLPEVGRWSAETASDNKLHCHKTNSPNPLPNPDITPDTYLSKSLDSESQYMVNTQHYLNSDPHYVHKLMKNDYYVKLADNFHEYVDHGSETEDKHHLGDKYLFPYTGESNTVLYKIVQFSH
ncbi:starry night [Carabus blaptoides fortunei]